MKNVLIGLGSAFLILLLLCGGLLFWAFRAGSAIQNEFFTSVVSGDPQKVFDLMHPALRDEVDPPVLAVWMREVESKLGQFQGFSVSDFNTSTRYENNQRITESKGTVNFEHGSATSELVYLDGQLTRFMIESPQIPDGWIQNLDDTSFYQQRGRDFLTAFFGGDKETAFGMMHRALQEAVPEEKLSEMMEKVIDSFGQVQSIDFKDDVLTLTDGQRLKIFFDVRGEKASTVAMIEYQFAGMKAHLVAFDMAADIP